MLAKVLIFVLLWKFSLAITFYEVNAQSFTEQASKRYFQLFDKLSAETYELTEEEDFSKLYDRVATVKLIAEELVDISVEAQKFNQSLIQNNNLKIALRRLSHVSGLFVLGDEYFESILISLNALKNLSIDKDIKPYAASGMSEPIAYNPDIKRIYETSKDTNELKYYWEIWREKNAVWAALNYHNIVDSIQRAAKLLDLPVLDFYYRDYDGSQEIIKEINEVMVELKPSYLQLHAFVRHQLKRKYPNEDILNNGLIPAHLFEQVIAQSWKNDSMIEEYFPFEILPPYDSFMEGFTSEKLIFEAQKFYKSLGFADLKDDFVSQRLQQLSPTETLADCQANIFDLTPKVRMQYCANVDFKKFIQMHGYLGRLHYAWEKQNLPSYFFASYNLEYAVGEAVILAASTAQHLNTIGMTKDFRFSEEAYRNPHIRMAIHTILNIPQYYIHIKVMNAMLENKVKMDGVNQLYWKLMQEYAGVEPPLDRKELSIDFPYKFYIDLESNHQTKKFVSVILGYQLYKAFCQMANAQGSPLNTCDFYGNRKVGNVMKSMMSLGSSKPWNETLFTILPQNPSLSADALLEYYEPIMTWIREFNKQNEVPVGWSDMTKTKPIL
ncbi:angiotensin-converting enzyme-like [Haematobia irritans]|uniref:angiotensin-converting enzyme-like n=1 Tax=Haematobia irritans TaxID=7368 RepID=UPI003F507DA0